MREGRTGKVEGVWPRAVAHGIYTQELRKYYVWEPRFASVGNFAKLVSTRGESGVSHP